MQELRLFGQRLDRHLGVLAKFAVDLAIIDARTLQAALELAAELLARRVGACPTAETQWIGGGIP